MSKSPAISDQHIITVLGAYAGMVDRVLRNPGRWLGTDEHPPPCAPFPARALDALRDRALGDKTPASPTWGEEPVQRRVDWWVTRIGVSAGLAAAAPRFFGALANRVPLQAALGAAAAGLAVCAAAREHGATAPEEWIPILGRVLFDRELHAGPDDIPDTEASEQQLEGDTAGSDGGSDGSGGVTDGARRAAGTVWHLARGLTGLDELLGHRPRGGRLVRLVAQVPVVGVASGWLDERGGIKKAAREASHLVQQPSPA